MSNIDSAADAQENVSLTVPSDLRHLRTVRLTTASVISSWDFDVDRVEDLRLAVTEACTLLWGDHGTDGSLQITFALGPGAARICIQLTVGSERDPDLADALESYLAESILVQLTDRLVHDPTRRLICLVVNR